MNRSTAIMLLQECALASGSRGEHDYLPVTRTEAVNWEPHEWVIRAVIAASNPTVFLGVEIQNVNEKVLLSNFDSEELNKFSEWFKQLETVHCNCGSPYGSESLVIATGIECWYSFFEGGSSPSEALEVDLSAI